MKIKEHLLNHEDRIKCLEKFAMKYRVLVEMSDVIEKAEKEYNTLRNFVGETYPKGKCGNILKLFQVLNEIRRNRCSPKKSKH